MMVHLIVPVSVSIGLTQTLKEDKSYNYVEGGVEDEKGKSAC